MVHFCAKLIRAEDSSAVTQPRRDRTHYLHGAWLRTQGNAVVHIRLAGSVLRIVTDHLPDLQCFEFWFGGLQKSFQHLRLLSRAYHGERHLRHPSATYTRISQHRLIPEQIPNHRRIRVCKIRCFRFSFSITVLRHHASVTKHTAPFADAFGQHKSEHYSQVTGLYWLQACTLI